MSAFRADFFRPMHIAQGGADDKSKKESGAATDKSTTKSGGRSRAAAKRNRKKAVVDPSENCAVYVVVEADVHYIDVFDTMPRVGKVKSCWINRPDGEHPSTSTVKLVFFAHAAAQRLLDGAGAGAWRINGTAPHCTWDRHCVGPEAGAGKSRVLRVTGHADFVSYDGLGAYFASKLRYETQKVGTVRLGATGMSQVDWYFASYANQAQVARMALERERPDVAGNAEGVRVEFRPDPCDPSGEV
ncbi:hypothetical protein F4809DRAFT_643467 [Biscogniauxia mediterranea]|nr:hypothetical protein F4809DRAFT_643467 [Biscogniauxia mediterranea]